jgi:NAD(P)H-dependent FMN reductase
MTSIRILHFSPSTATGRHDSHRASLLLAHFINRAAALVGIDVGVHLVWALPAITSKQNAQALMQGADVIVIASPTYAQGSPWFLRRFLELGAGLQLWGSLGTAIATAGGQHTGGDVTVADTLRSLHGMGMCTFTFAQKYMVFATQQKLVADGRFEPADAWFLQKMAETVLSHALTRKTSTPAAEWAARFGLSTCYYNHFPSPADLRSAFTGIIERINAPLEIGAPAYAWWTEALGFEALPPDAGKLSFFDLLPDPGASGPLL